MTTGVPDEVMLTMSLLSGESVSCTLPGDKRVRHVKINVCAQLGALAPGLVQILGPQGEIDDSVTVDSLRTEVLSLIIRSADCVPFVEGDVPEGSLVLVDGVPATFGYAKGGWGSSDKILFAFDHGQRHPEYNAVFQTKDWMNRQPGQVEFRGGRVLQVQWVRMEGEGAQEWVVHGVSVLVRTSISLDSEEVGRLYRGTVVNVTEAEFLHDADCTPRLRISSPISGWLTPHLSSTSAVLMKPAGTKRVEMSGVLGSIAQLCALLQI